MAVAVSSMQLIQPTGSAEMTVASGIVAFGIKAEIVHSRGLHL